jgi:hypothetical protein
MECAVDAYWYRVSVEKKRKKNLEKDGRMVIQ